MTKDKILRLRLSEKERQMLEEICENKLMSMSQMVRSLILKEYKKIK